MFLERLRYLLRTWLLRGVDPNAALAEVARELLRLERIIDEVTGRACCTENVAAAANSRSERLEARMARVEALAPAVAFEPTLTDVMKRLKELEERADRAQRLHRRQFVPVEPDGSP